MVADSDRLSHDQPNHMNDSLVDFLHSFWRSLAISLFFAALSWVQIRRRNWVLRYLDAEESFWARVGVPKGGSFRKFSESRWSRIISIFFAVIFLLSALFSLGSYLYFRHGIQG
jgi:hypothetical protein